MIQSGRDIFLDQKIKNSVDQTFFAHCLVLGLAQSGRWADERQVQIHQPVTTKEMEPLADERQVQIHCFDIIGVNPGFFIFLQIVHMVIIFLFFKTTTTSISFLTLMEYLNT